MLWISSLELCMVVVLQRMWRCVCVCVPYLLGIPTCSPWYSNLLTNSYWAWFSLKIVMYAFLFLLHWKGGKNNALLHFSTGSFYFNTNFIETNQRQNIKLHRLTGQSLIGQFSVLHYQNSNSGEWQKFIRLLL